MRDQSGARRHIAAAIELKDADPIPIGHELGGGTAQLRLQELLQLGGLHPGGIEMLIQLRQGQGSCREKGCCERRALVPRLERSPLEEQAAVQPGLGNGGTEASLQFIHSALLIEQQSLACGIERFTARGVLADHHLRVVEVAGHFLQGFVVAGDPDQALPQGRVIATAPYPHPLNPLFLGEEAEIDRDRSILPRIQQGSVINLPSIRKAGGPTEVPPFEPGELRLGHQGFEAFLNLPADLGAGGVDLIALPAPLLSGGRLDLVALLLGIAQQVAAPQGLQCLTHSRQLVACIDAVGQASRHQGVIGGDRVLDQLQQRHRLGRPQHQRTVFTSATGQDSGHRLLGVRIERCVLDLVDHVQAHQGADRLLSQVLAAEQFPQQLQQASNRLVITLRTTGACAQHRGDLQDQFDLSWQQGIDIHELLFRGLLAAVCIELEVGAVAGEQFAQLGGAIGRLFQKPPVHHIADVGGGEMYSQLGWKAILCPREKGVARRFIELLLPQSKQPGLAPQRSPQCRREGTQPVGSVAIVQDILRDLVHHQEEGGVRLAVLDHVAHRLDRLFR